MRRRTFMQKVVMGAGVVGFATLPFGLARLLAPEVKAEPHRRVPLPGALPDADAFNEACIGCGLCGEICPVCAVKFHRNDGAGGVNTPYINPEQKACILCGLCMEVCPTDALTVTPVREVDMGTAQIDRVACYPWVDAGVCGACVGICPLGSSAIDFEFGNFYRPVVQDGCVGCGLCVEVCPEPSLPIRIVDRSKGTVAHHGIGVRRTIEYR